MIGRFACRAGTGTASSFGDQLTRSEANIGSAYPGGDEAGNRAGKATPVGKLDPDLTTEMISDLDAPPRTSFIAQRFRQELLRLGVICHSSCFWNCNGNSAAFPSFGLCAQDFSQNVASARHHPARKPGALHYRRMRTVVHLDPVRQVRIRHQP